MPDKKTDIDIINAVLEDCIIAYPVSSFVISLYKQYRQRGSLSKKQLEGLHSKASKIKDMPAGRLATLEAKIKRMPTRQKSELPEIKPMIEKDNEAEKMIADILKKYPQHKRVLFLKSKFDNNEVLTKEEITDMKRIIKTL